MVLYFSATGNSMWVARQLAEALAMNKHDDDGSETESEQEGKHGYLSDGEETIRDLDHDGDAETSNECSCSSSEDESKDKDKDQAKGGAEKTGGSHFEQPSRGLNWDITFCLLTVFSKPDTIRFYNAKKGSMHWSKLVRHMQSLPELQGKMYWLGSQPIQTVRNKTRSLTTMIFSGKEHLLLFDGGKLNTQFSDLLASAKIFLASTIKSYRDKRALAKRRSDAYMPVYEFWERVFSETVCPAPFVLAQRAALSSWKRQMAATETPEKWVPPDSLKTNDKLVEELKSLQCAGKTKEEKEVIALKYFAEKGYKIDQPLIEALSNRTAEEGAEVAKKDSKPVIAIPNPETPMYKLLDEFKQIKQREECCLRELTTAVKQLVDVFAQMKQPMNQQPFGTPVQQTP